MNSVRQSRWNRDPKFKVSGIPVALPSTLAPEQVESYVLHIRLEEINRKLRTDDVLPLVERRRRSVSPEPIYGADGKRVNTKEWRARQKLEEERTKLIEIGLATIPGFRPPGDFKRLTKTSQKIYIPQRDHPDINFIGLLIGPRGHTLKKMEQESRAKISIRGKGSVKEGKNRIYDSVTGEEEELHCYITSDSEEKVQRAVDAVQAIIKQALEAPGGQLELKRNQLRELALLNGTLRDDDNSQACQNCGGYGHKRYECPEEANVTTTIMCRICGAAGHAEKDCLERNNPIALEAAHRREQQLKEEYHTLMAELGGGPVPIPAAPSAAASNPIQPIQAQIQHHPQQVNTLGFGYGNVIPVDPTANAYVQPYPAYNMMAPPGMAFELPPGMDASMAPPGLAPPGLLPPGMDQSMAPPGYPYYQQ